MELHTSTAFQRSKTFTRNSTQDQRFQDQLNLRQATFMATPKNPLSAKRTNSGIDYIRDTHHPRAIGRDNTEAHTYCLATICPSRVVMKPFSLLHLYQSSGTLVSGMSSWKGQAVINARYESIRPSKQPELITEALQQDQPSQRGYLLKFVLNESRLLR